MDRRHVFDGHCDVLYQLWQRKSGDLFFSAHEDLHCSFHRLRLGKVKVQTMAVFVPPEVPVSQKKREALRILDLFHEEILSCSQIKLVVDSETLLQADTESHSLFVILSLEGADPIEEVHDLRTFFRLGVRSIGLTWNFRNRVADGVDEPHPGGLSRFGMDLVQEMNRLQLAIDVAHLAQPAFWDVLSLSSQPVMASHCNAYRINPHRRNLTDEQLRAIFTQQGMVGISFVPSFLEPDGEATITSVLRHLDHMLSLGGENCVGFGSDFDGIDRTVKGLGHSGEWKRFLEICHRYYSPELVDKLIYTNWRNYYLRLWRSR